MKVIWKLQAVKEHETYDTDTVDTTGKSSRAIWIEEGLLGEDPRRREDVVADTSPEPSRLGIVTVMV